MNNDPENPLTEEEQATLVETSPGQIPYSPALPGIRSFINSVEAIRRFGWVQLIDLIMAKLAAPFLVMFGKIRDWIYAAEDDVWETMLKGLEQAKFMDRATANKLLAFKGLPAPFQSVFNMIILSSWLTTYVKTVAEVTIAQKTQELQKQFRPTLPDPAALIRSAFIAPEKTDEVRDLLARQGFSEKAIDYLFLSNYQLYDIQTVRDLFFRKEISTEKVYERLMEMGFTQTRIEEIMMTWQIIPPIPDLIQMSVKEAFSPEIAQKYGQFEDFPSAVGEWGEKQGLSTEWLQRYWAAHWQLPSPQMGFEMLHRGLIDEEELKLLLRALDIMPYWRDRMIKINYNPYTRVDVRRMHKAGVLADADLVKNYMDIGYDAEHAQNMADFTVQYNKEDDKLLTQAQIIRGYREAMLSRDETYDLLISLRFSEERADLYIAIADYEETLELQTLYVDAVKQRYINNFYDEVKARTELTKLNLPGARIDALMEKWSTTKMLDVKIPSKTDLDKFMKNKIIDEDQYKTEMNRLGYSWNYTQWYLKLIEKGKAGN